MITTIEKANSETLVGLEKELEEQGLLEPETSTEDTQETDELVNKTVDKVEDETSTEEKNTTEDTEEAAEETAEEVKPIESPEWVSKYVTEFEETGELSSESVESLKTEYKIPEALINNYVQLAKQNRDFATQATEAKFNSEVITAAGGKAEYDRLVKYAGENLSEAEVTAYNKALDSKDVEKVSLYLENFKLKSGTTNSVKPSTKTGGKASGSTGGGVKPFKSQAEAQKAMDDPKYLRDEAYTKEVEQRVFKSTY